MGAYYLQHSAPPTSGENLAAPATLSEPPSTSDRAATAAAPAAKRESRTLPQQPAPLEKQELPSATGVESDVRQQLAASGRDEEVQAEATPAKSNVQEPQPLETDPASKAEAEAAPAETPEQAASEPVEPVDLPAFDAGAAKTVLADKASQASGCRRGADPAGTAEVFITFAPSGRVTSANVNGAPFGGTATGGCIAATLRGARVPAFGGKHMTVRKLVKVY